jgi:hypothetical protein
VCFVEGHGTPTGGGLGIAFDDGVAGGGAVAFDEQQPPVEVDGHPPQAAEFAAAQAAQRGEPPECEQRVVDRAGQEGVELLGGPDRDGGAFAGLFPVFDAAVGPDLGVWPLVAGDLDVSGRIAVDQLFPHSQVQRRS